MTTSSFDRVPLPANALSYMARVVYGKIFRLANGEGFDGIAQIRIGELARYVGYCRSSVEKALAELREAFWIISATDGRKSFFTPLVALAQKQLRWLEDRRHAPAPIPAGAPSSFTYPVRIQESSRMPSSIRKTKSTGNYQEENILTKIESVPVPAPVVGSLALQRGKENVSVTRLDCSSQFTKSSLLPEQADSPKAYASGTAKAKPESVTTAKTGQAAANPISPIREGMRETPPLDLPAAAAQLVTEGKIAAKIVLRHIRRASREIVETACAAVIEISQREPIRCYERAVCRAVGEEWKPSGDFTLPYHPGTVSADYVKPLPDAPAADWPGASEKRLHSADSQFSSTEGRMVRCAGTHRALVMRMVNWIFRDPQGRPDDDAEWVAVARSVVAAGSYLHLPMDWEAPRMEGGKR